MQIAILVYPGMTALDAVGPYEIFHVTEAWEIRFVWKEVGPIVTDSGALIIGATHTLEETPEPDLILIPGSSADSGTVAADADVVAWLKAAHAHTRFTTSVCSGALVLAAAGILEGKPATTHWLAIPVLKGLGIDARPSERIVRSGKVFTAAGVSAGIDLALALVAEIHGEDEAQIAQLLVEYDPQPPFDAGHISKASGSIKRRAAARMAKMALNPRDVISLPKVVGRLWMERLRGKSSQ